MSFTNRQFHRGEQPHYVQTQRNGPNKFNQYFYVRAGIIEAIDYDKYEMTIRWSQSDGARSKIPISFPYVGPAGCMGMLPEKGAMGIFGFYDEGGGKGSPLCLAYLPAGLYAGLNFNNVKIKPDQLPNDDVNEILHKFRKLTEGDMIVASPLGGTLFLNRSVELKDGMQDSILIREGDQSIITTSMNNFVFADGVSINSGPAIRNFLKLYNADGTKVTGTLGSAVSMPNGKDTIYLVPNGDPIDYTTEYFVEYRVDVDEMGDGSLDMNDINSSSQLSTRNPIVTMAMGNYIGADRRDALYGKILRANLFKSANDQLGQFILEAALQNNGVDEPGTTGLAWVVHLMKAGALFGFDKEGHCYMNLGGSLKNPLGAGRSMSILAPGNLKEIWGKTALDNNSWDLTTKGGIRWNVGAHNLKGAGRSIEIRADRGMSLEIVSPDDNGIGKQEIITGTSIESINGNKAISCSSMNLIINGLKREAIAGSHTQVVQSDKSLNVLGVYSETAVKEKQCKFGKRKTTITTGNDELKLIRGNIDETITTFGKRKTTITAGGIEETIITGNRKTMITAGNYKVEVTAGMIKVKTTAGTVTIEGTTVAVKGTAMVNVSAPMVKLGNGAAIGGVISGLPGIPSHFDYMCGMAHKGSMKVSVG